MYNLIKSENIHSKLTIHVIFRDSDPKAVTSMSLGGPEGASSNITISTGLLGIPYPTELLALILTI